MRGRDGSVRAASRRKCPIGVHAPLRVAHHGRAPLRVVPPPARSLQPPCHPTRARRRPRPHTAPLTDARTTHAPEAVHSIQRLLERLHARHAGLDDGEVATCIPELTKADPASFGICVVSAEGRVFEVGDSRKPFTIQSVSKPPSCPSRPPATATARSGTCS